MWATTKTPFTNLLTTIYTRLRTLRSKLHLNTHTSEARKCTRSRTRIMSTILSGRSSRNWSWVSEDEPVITNWVQRRIAATLIRALSSNKECPLILSLLALSQGRNCQMDRQSQLLHKAWPSIACKTGKRKQKIQHRLDNRWMSHLATNGNIFRPASSASKNKIEQDTCVPNR